MANPSIPAGPGRPKGGKNAKYNARSRTAADLIAKACPGWDPLVWLARVAQGLELPEASTSDRIAAARDVRRCLHPELSAIAHTGADGKPLRLLISKDDANL